MRVLKAVTAAVIFTSALVMATEVQAWCFKRECTIGNVSPEPAPYIEPLPLPPPGPTPEELQRQAEEQQRRAEEQARVQRLWDAYNLNEQGVAASKRGEWDAAAEFYRKALEKNPGDPVIRNNFAQMVATLEDVGKAKEIMQSIDDLARAMGGSTAGSVAGLDFVNTAKMEADEQKGLPSWEERKAVFIKDETNYKSQIQTLMNQIKDIKVPMPDAYPRKIHEGVMLGLNDPASDVEEKYKGVKSPFTGKELSTKDIFATTNSGNFMKEFLRGVGDNTTLGEVTLEGDQGRKLVKRLQGAQFDRLMAHSNGATVAEALIRSDTIKVDELNVIGGDRSLVNKMGLQELIDTGKVKRVVIWINPGDPIPMGSSAPQVAMLTNAVNNPMLNAAAKYFSDRLMGVRTGGDAVVETRYLEGAAYTPASQKLDLSKEHIWDAHALKGAYLDNMKTYFGQSGGAK